MTKSKTATLHFLAEKLNIHDSTVSRVLNGDTTIAAKAASALTRKQIHALAAQYNYVPNPHAVNLRTSKSRLIGVSVPKLSDYVWASIYEGIEEYALENGYFAYVTNSYDNAGIQGRQLSLALTRRVDGLIIGDAHTTPESEKFLNSLEVPFILALRRTGNFLSVTCDDIAGGRQAAEHLFARGHRDVAILAGSAITTTGQERTAGFVRFYQEAGYPIAPERIVFSHFDTEAGREGAKYLLARFPSLTAIYAVNDFAAIGAMGAMRLSGIVPGSDMALIGYNDTPLAAELPIPLTTLRNPFRELGTEAMRLLLSLLGGEACESILLKPRLVVRESSNFTARALP
jgi:LacI family transcriptional regulator